LLSIAQGGVKNNYFIAHHYSPIFNASFICCTISVLKKQKPQQFAGAGTWWLMIY
jgi:hypothetical protein